MTGICSAHQGHDPACPRCNAIPELVPQDSPKLTAAVEMIGRTGAETFAMRWSDEEQPVVWMAVAGYADGRHEAAAALNPVRAALRLCEQLIDGGACQHCHRPSGFDPDSIDELPLDGLVCWYQFDPELEKFRRACEGDDA